MSTLGSIITAPARLAAWLVASVVAAVAAVLLGVARLVAGLVGGLARLALWPVRVAAVVVAATTRLSARLVGLSARTSARAVGGSARFAAASTVGSARTVAGVGRAATRSSIVAFAVGVALGWFLGTPTGRRLRREATSLVAPSGGDGPVSDDELAARVRAALRGSPRTWHLAEPTVDVHAGVVSLTGEAAHPEARTDLEVTVSGVAGVMAVDNRLVLAGPTA
ncbi:MAG TPA: BON domain-containing protein [Acidimicrobiales bacterium]|nr:BON domain-containing protein [Acidimicrobiales bacterium]